MAGGPLVCHTLASRAGSHKLGIWETVLTGSRTSSCAFNETPEGSTRSKKLVVTRTLLGAPGIATRSKDAPSSPLALLPGARMLLGWRRITKETSQSLGALPVLLQERPSISG